MQRLLHSVAVLDSPAPVFLNPLRPPKKSVLEKSGQASPALAQSGGEGDMRLSSGEGPAERENVAFSFQNTARIWPKCGYIFYFMHLTQLQADRLEAV